MKADLRFNAKSTNRVPISSTVVFVTDNYMCLSLLGPKAAKRMRHCLHMTREEARTLAASLIDASFWDGTGSFSTGNTFDDLAPNTRADNNAGSDERAQADGESNET